MLARLGRLQGMKACEGSQDSQFLVDDGVVLHSARPQGIEAVVDTEVVVAQIGIVAYHRQFVTFGQLGLLLAQQRGRQLLRPEVIAVGRQ